MRHICQGTATKTILFLLFSFLIFFIVACLFPLSASCEQWPGVDKSVVERIAGEHGKEAKEPLINMGQGDLPLFLFLLAGAVGGFAAGYYWKTLLVNKTRHDKSEARP